MPHNIGLDFGSTYSIISNVKNIERDLKGNIISYDLEAFSPGQSESYCQPSLIMRKGEEYYFGVTARNKIVSAKKKPIVYRGFKMMLAEKNTLKLKERGFDDVVTPHKAVKLYIENFLERYARTSKKEEISIDKLVIGVPEVWFSGNEVDDSSKKVITPSADNRRIIKEIVSSIPLLRSTKIELVSEPAAACAYFVHNYKKSTGKNFNGHLLLIDYGGGTLDVALCKVCENGNKSEVTVIEKSGAGENTEGHIGEAGLAFMDEVVQLSLEKTGLSRTEIFELDDFSSIVTSLESDIIAKTKDIEDCFEDNDGAVNEYQIEDIVSRIDLDDDRVSNIPSGGYPVTCGILAKAYDNVIRRVLERELKSIIKYMDDNGIRYDSKSIKDDSFKIAEVGGFCNFYKTRKQIRDIFKISVNDTRQKNIINDARDCEKAISYGAALIAEGIIEFKQLAPYSLGFAKGNEKNVEEIFYVIKKGQEIKYDEPVYYTNENGEIIRFLGKKIPMIAFKPDVPEGKSDAICRVPSEKYSKQLELETGTNYDTSFAIGFSFDKSTIISLHKKEFKNGTFVKETSAVLDDIYEVVGFTQVN